MSCRHRPKRARRAALAPELARSQNYSIISDMKSVHAPNSLPKVILRHAQALPEGGVLTPKEFLHLGNRAAVDQAFSRLARTGKLLRIGRGLYTPPVHTKFGERAPAADRIVRILAQTTGERIASHGASAANTLGLTKQVPVREVYLTSGRTQQLRLGKAKVLLKKAPSWMLALEERPAGAAVRALAWLGPSQAAAALRRLHHTLPPEEWQVLAAARGVLPGWLAKAIGAEAAHG